MTWDKKLMTIIYGLKKWKSEAEGQASSRRYTDYTAVAVTALMLREFFNRRPIFRSPFMRGHCSAQDSGITRMLRKRLWVLI